MSARAERLLVLAPWAIAAAAIVLGSGCAIVGYGMAADANDQLRAALAQQARIATQIGVALDEVGVMRQHIVGPRAPVVLMPCVDLRPELGPMPLLGMGGP